MRMELFEHRLKGKLNDVVAGHSYANSQEMYPKAIKIARVVDENEATKEKRHKQKQSLVQEVLTPNLRGNLRG